MMEDRYTLVERLERAREEEGRARWKRAQRGNAYNRAWHRRALDAMHAAQDALQAYDEEYHHDEG